jgi:hypothetical protein
LICLIGSCLLLCSASIPARSLGGWRSAPVVPKLGRGIRSKLAGVLATGRRRGNRADVFAKVGDSISQSPAFLQGIGCGQVAIGGHSSLRSAIKYFSARRLEGTSADCPAANSFSRASAATQAFAVSEWALSAGANSNSSCEPGESPLTCELRIDRPGWAVVLFGTNDVTVGSDIVHADTLPGFLESMGEIITEATRDGTVPILSTIPPRIDPTDEAWTERFNGALYRLARSRRIPMINLWRALDPLANHGLSADNLHPSLYGGAGCTGYCDPASCAPACQAANFTAMGLRYGYDVRNLITLETLARLRQAIRAR